MEKNVKLNKMELKIEIALRKARKKEMEKVVGKTKEVDQILDPFKPIAATETHPVQQIAVQ
jgi:hypothetical protein